MGGSNNNYCLPGFSLAIVVWSCCFPYAKALITRSYRHDRASSSQRFPRSAVFTVVRRLRTHQPVQPKIPPSWLLDLLRCALDAKGRMLIRYNVVLVVGIDGLVLWRNVDFLSW
jgi:hypothetical protein